MRRASTSRSSSNFNPRPSYEERPEQELCEMMDAISIHAPHTRSDLRRHVCQARRVGFQSTPLIRGATKG